MSRPTSFGHSRIERLNDPERPTSIAEAVELIIAEDTEQKRARRRAGWSPAITFEPCENSPSGAHWWVYPPQGVRGAAVCRYCRTRHVQNARAAQ